MEKFCDVLGRFEAKRLSTLDAAELLGMSERSFRRYQAALRGGRSGRPVRPPARQGVVAPGLCGIGSSGCWSSTATRHVGWTVKHFHNDHLRAHHGFHLSHSWTKTVLQACGAGGPGRARRGAHHRRRPRKPCRGMMLHQDGSRQRVAGRPGAARSDRHPWTTPPRRSTRPSWSRRKARPRPSGRSSRCSPSTACPARCTPTAAATTSTPPRPAARSTRAGTPRSGAPCTQLGIEHIAAYSPEARGRSERAFGTLQDRLVKELALAGIDTVEAANRFIEERYLPDHNRRFAIPPELDETAFVPLVRPDQIDDILCLHAERVSPATTPCATPGGSCNSPPAPIARTTSRRRSGCTSIPTARSPSSTDPGARPATTPMANRS